MSEHTALPWEQDATLIWAPESKKVVAGVSVTEPVGGLVAYEEPSYGSSDLHEIYANAEYIVRACNLFPELVRELEQIAQLMGYGIDVDDESWLESHKAIHAVLAKARAGS